jgi:hypothetical protein
MRKATTFCFSVNDIGLLVPVGYRDGCLARSYCFASTSTYRLQYRYYARHEAMCVLLRLDWGLLSGRLRHPVSKKCYVFVMWIQDY